MLSVDFVHVYRKNKVAKPSCLTCTEYLFASLKTRRSPKCRTKTLLAASAHSTKWRQHVVHWLPPFSRVYVESHLLHVSPRLTHCSPGGDVCVICTIYVPARELIKLSKLQCFWRTNERCFHVWLWLGLNFVWAVETLEGTGCLWFIYSYADYN